MANVVIFVFGEERETCLMPVWLKTLNIHQRDLFQIIADEIYLIIGKIVSFILTVEHMQQLYLDNEALNHKVVQQFIDLKISN